MLSPETSTDAEISADPVLLTPDVMARILEPRVRSNAKNNSKFPKTVTTKKVAVSVAGNDSEPEKLSETPSETLNEPPVETALTPEAARVMLPETPAPTPEATSGAAPEISLQTSPNEVLPALSELRELLLSIQETQENRDRAFDLLYDELSGYKNDFHLERLKPSLRALLFLLDSIEGFERELNDYDGRGDAVLIKLVKANLVHFRDQLTDVLTILELTPIELEDDKFDPKTQRAVEVVPVEAPQNNMVQRQIRGGWRLGGKMLRAADVVVGRSS